jgi:hypothetical protein
VPRSSLEVLYGSKLIVSAARWGVKFAMAISPPSPLGFPDLRILKDLRDKSLRSVHSNGVTKERKRSSGTKRRSGEEWTQI